MKIETKRLTITKFTMDMAEAVHKESLDEDNRRFLPDEVFETEEDAAKTVDAWMGVYENGNDPLVYPVMLKEGTYIGYVKAVPNDDGTWQSVVISAKITPGRVTLPKRLPRSFRRS